MPDTLFSIIIPTYNRADFIVKTIESILAQSYTNFEVIVIDDGSTDNTQEIVTTIEDKRIKYYKKINEERAIARNCGMTKAKGDYITFIDSDDIMYPNCLLDASNFIKSNPLVNIFHNLFELINEKGGKNNPYNWKLSNNDIKNIATGNHLACIGVFISKNIFSEFKFDENPIIIGSEDWDFWLRIIAQEKKIGTINKINSAMIEHEKRSMNNLNINQLIERRLYILNKIKTDPLLSKNYASFYNYIESSSYLFIASNAAAVQLKKIAIQYLVKSIKSDVRFLFNIRTIIILKNILLK